ncbi:hypothetical protein [Rhizobium sp. LjRoot254]|uniref:hypothetical protein n=1 Tax=Rhizobium sp. LjRoot254 TaxID=3342297 RepID=UPI003ECE3567
MFYSNALLSRVMIFAICLPFCLPGGYLLLANNHAGSANRLPVSFPKILARRYYRPMRTPSVPEQLESMIAAIRESGVGSSALAREIGISRQTLWRLEAGDARLPSAETFTEAPHLT